ncbi:MAG: bifunctional homocysteine S-methyltransferase/methylenetetrahydrofolate reductase [Candidatus Melainabacteria bacterium]|nr:bifunctional homocysteine S-methyltransferase/methylenetetrahydrofolate reductase [Candidatus Melainabacteria bacterium]
MSHPFLTALKERPLLADGAMGTLLYARGASPECSFEQLNLTRQDLVQQVHIDYINAGADVIETNSFSGNRFRLANFGLEDEVWKLNVWAAKVARNGREVAGQSVFVAGSVGPTGRLLPPYGDTKPSDVEAAFTEQMEGLLAGGVDLFMIETMSSLEETSIAVRAARKVCQLPVVAQLSFSIEGHTAMGATPEDMVLLVSNLGDDAPDVIGINCGAGPGPLLDYLLRMIYAVEDKHLSADRLVYSCLPNAGMPSLIDGRFMYMSRPDYCASFVEPYINAGARLVGGCCGTTPEHTKAMRVTLDKYLESSSRVVQTLKSGQEIAHPVQVSVWDVLSDTRTGNKVSSDIDLVEKAPGKRTASTSVLGIAPHLSREPGTGFFISVELDPPKGTIARKIVQAANKLAAVGVDAINVGDSPMARVRMSSMATCHLVRQQTGIETIIHFTTRDRNLMGIQADLLGCQALGINTILALTGDPPSVGTYAHATAVYDVDSVGLIKIISQLNQGVDIAGNSIGSPTALSIGCALNPTAENRQQEIERIRRKVDSGAHFIMTQPIYQLRDLTDFLHQWGEYPIPILVGIMPLHSFKHAEYLHNEVPGITIPKPIRKAMENAGQEGSAVGLELAEELLEEVRNVASGVYLVPSFGRYDDMCILVERIKKKFVAY